MGWLFKESGRGGKQGWTEQTLSSVSAPPLPLLSIFAIICLLLLLSSYVNFKKEVHHTVLNLKLFLLFLPVFLIFAAQFASKCERFVFPYAKTKRELRRTRDLPWGIVVLLVVLLVMVSYQSYFRSMWSPNIWRSDF